MSRGAKRTVMPRPERPHRESLPRKATPQVHAGAHSSLDHDTLSLQDSPSPFLPHPRPRVRHDRIQPRTPGFTPQVEPNAGEPDITQVRDRPVDLDDLTQAERARTMSLQVGFFAHLSAIWPHEDDVGVQERVQGRHITRPQGVLKPALRSAQRLVGQYGHSGQGSGQRQVSRIATTSRTCRRSIALDDVQTRPWWAAALRSSRVVRGRRRRGHGSKCGRSLSCHSQPGM